MFAERYTLQPWRFGGRRSGGRGFTLVELLVVLAIVSLLISMLMPSLGGAREAARNVVCQTRLKQLVVAWTMYAGEHRDYAMPMSVRAQSGVPERFWWGGVGTRYQQPDFSLGLLAPYFDAGLAERSAFECPSQAWGTYDPQGNSRHPEAPPPTPTSTYGYNGYFLAPAATPGWQVTIGRQRWQRLHTLTSPSALYVFGDAMLGSVSETARPMNNALLDPPLLWTGWGQGPNFWMRNSYPTTSFRHFRQNRGAGSTNTARADSSVHLTQGRVEWFTQPHQHIGSIGTYDSPEVLANDPGYVPNWREWR
ncbi:MAG: prepilin-type N-terminal cleavage/methylation domain-containing protein [Planctomycetota bacterium]|nr:prepilin-type N-terminal cleavage/methylation domain-containing protein [Planctomycetota bacterium]